VFIIFFSEFRKYFRNEFLKEVSAVVFVGFEHGSEKLSKSDLKFHFILVLLLENLNVLFVEATLILICIFFLVLVVIINSVLRLLDEIVNFTGEGINAIRLEEVASSLVNNLLNSLSLLNQDFSLCLGVHGLN
jgi:hypothetical protein